MADEKKPKIQEHSIVSIESDRDRVRMRPAIYTTSVDADGCVHIVFEIVDNAIDELTAHDSVGDSVTLVFDRKTKVFSVIDNGGGIPHAGMLKAVSVLSSSGKYENSEQSHFAESGGFNGYGTKLLTFLSDWAEYTSCQKGKSLTYKFEDGLLVDTIEGKSKEHGTTVSGLITDKIMDIHHVDYKVIHQRFEEKSYMFPDLKMTLIETDDGKTVKEHRYFGNDIVSRVKKWKPDTEIIRASAVKKYTILDDISADKPTEKKVTVDVAFAYKEDVMDGNAEDYIISYANGIKTYTGGEHVNGIKAGIQKWFNEQVKPKFSKRDKDLQVTPSDMVAGLCAFVTVKLYDPQFHGQVKDRLDNQEARYAVRDAVYEALCDAKPSVVNPMIEFIKRVTRGRMASKKVRKKDVSSAFSVDRIDKFTDVVNSIKTSDPELLLCEG